MASILRPVRFCEIWALRDKAKGLRIRSTILAREGLRRHEKVQADFRSAEQVSVANWPEGRKEVVWRSRSQSKFIQTKWGQYGFLSLLLLFSSLSYAEAPAPCEALIQKLSLAEESDELIALLLESGSELKKKGRWVEHIRFSEIALQRCEEKGRMEDRARLCTQVASTYFYQGDFLSCEEKAKVAYEIYIAKGAEVGQVASLYLLSAASRGLKNFEKSIAIGHAALALFQEGNCQNELLEAKILFNLAAAYMDQEKPEPLQAETLLIACILLAEKAQDKSCVFRASLRLAKTYLLLDRVGESQDLLYSLSDTIQEPREWMHYHYLLAQLFVKKEEPKQALVHAKKAQIHAEELHAVQDLRRISQLIVTIRDAERSAKPLLKSPLSE